MDDEFDVITSIAIGSSGEDFGGTVRKIADFFVVSCTYPYAVDWIFGRMQPLHSRSVSNNLNYVVAQVLDAERVTQLVAELSALLVARNKSKYMIR